MNRPPRILVVEDDIDLQEMLRLRLDGEGFEVVVAGHWREAMARLADAPPHLMLLDLGLPGINGIAITRTVKDLLGDPVPIVVYSAYPDYERKARQAGAAAFVPKTAGLDALVGTIRRVLAEEVPA